VQRGHSREPVFFENDDYAAWRHWLDEAADRYDYDIHAKVLMVNHMNLAASRHDKQHISHMIRKIGRHYVCILIILMPPDGRMCEGRSKASLIHDE